jgi:TolA-binding protein
MSLQRYLWQYPNPVPELIQKELNRTTKLCNKEKRFIKIAGILHLYAAREYALNGKGIALKNEIQKAVTYLDKNAKEYENNRKLLINALHTYLNKMVKSGAFKAEVENINGIISSIPDRKLQFEVAATFYYHAGQFFFSQSQFQSSSEFFDRCVKMGESQFKKVCEKNASIAYLNQTAIAVNNNKCTTAKNSVKQCKEHYPDAEACKQAEKMVNENCK